MHAKLQRLAIGLGLLVVALFGFRTISTPAIWTHLALGRSIAQRGLPLTDPLSFSRAGTPWLDATWLYDLLLYGMWNQGGESAVLLLHIAAVLAAFLFLLPPALHWGGRTGAAAGLVLSGWLLGPAFHPGPFLFSLALAGAFVCILWKPRRAWIPWAVLVPAQIAWTNLHPSFLLGPPMALLFCWERRKESGRCPPLLPFVAALLLATLVNPYGPRLHLHVLGLLHDPALGYVSEWISPFSHLAHPGYTVYVARVALLLGAAGLVLERRALPLGLTCLGVSGGIWLVLRPFVHQEFFAVLAFPFLSLSGRAAGESLTRRWPGPAAGLRVAGGGMIVLAAILSLAALLSNQYYRAIRSPSSFGSGVERDLFPDAAALLIERPDFPAAAVNLWRDGGYLAWRFPGRKIFVDERFDLYGAEFYQQLAEGLSGQSNLVEQFEARWNAEALVINCSLPGATRPIALLLSSGRWGLSYFDGGTAVLLRALERHQALLNNPELQAAGSQVLETESREFGAQFNSGAGPSLPPRLIGAALLLVELRRYGEALSFYDLLRQGLPDLAAAWRGAGYCLIQMEKPAAAVETMEGAVARFPKDAWSHLLLSKAYVIHGETNKAERAFAQAGRLNTRLAEQFGFSPPVSSVTNSTRVLPDGL